MRILAQKKMPAKIDSLYALLDTVSGCADGEGIGHEQISSIKLAVEEVLVNIINYAYAGKEGGGDVELVCSISEEGKFVVEIADSGLPFDMLSAKDPDIHAGIDERRIGGLGIYFVKELMDEVHYKREENRNVLTLVPKKA